MCAFYSSWREISFVYFENFDWFAISLQNLGNWEFTYWFQIERKNTRTSLLLLSCVSYSKIYFWLLFILKNKVSFLCGNLLLYMEHFTRKKRNHNYQRLIKPTMNLHMYICPTLIHIFFPLSSKNVWITFFLNYTLCKFIAQIRIQNLVKNSLEHSGK